MLKKTSYLFGLSLLLLSVTAFAQFDSSDTPNTSSNTSELNVQPADQTLDPNTDRKIAQLSQSQNQSQALQQPEQATKKLDTKIDWSGEYRLRGRYLDRAYVGSSEPQDFYVHRFILKGSMAPNDDIETHFAINFNQALGGDEKRGFAGLRDGDTDDQNIQILKAYADWAFGSSFSVRFGRMELDWSHGALISKNDDDQQPYFFDGAVLGYDAAGFSLRSGVLRVGDWTLANSAPNKIDPDESAYFASLDFKPLSALLETTQVFFFRTQADDYNSAAVNIMGSSLNRIGLALGGASKGFYYSLDYVSQLGSYNNGVNSSAWMAQGEFGYKIDTGYNPTKFFIKAHYDTGDDAATTDTDEGYNPLYYNHHKYAGLMDVLAWGNLNYMGFGASVLRRKKTEFMLQALWFKLSDSSSGPSDISYLGYSGDNDTISEAVATNASGVTSSQLGYEIDFLYKRNFSSQAFLEVIGGVFVTGDYLEAYGRDKNFFSIRVSTGFEF